MQHCTVIGPEPIVRRIIIVCDGIAQWVLFTVFVDDNLAAMSIYWTACAKSSLEFQFVLRYQCC